MLGYYTVEVNVCQTNNIVFDPIIRTEKVWAYQYDDKNSNLPREGLLLPDGHRFLPGCIRGDKWVVPQEHFKTQSKKPDHWPDSLLVWNNSDAWDGMAVDPDCDENEQIIQNWLNCICDSDSNATEICAAECWALVEWDEFKGCYYRPRYEHANGTPFQYECKYAPEDIDYLADDYGD